MPTFVITPAPSRLKGTITGDRPFAARQTGGTAGAVDIVDATGAVTNPKLAGQGATSTFAEGSPDLDGVIEAANNSPLFTVAPAITGTPRVGVQLTVSAGTVTGTPAPAVTRQWLANGAPIAGATGLTYTPGAPQQGQRISVRTTAVNVEGEAIVTTAETAVVAAA